MCTKEAHTVGFQIKTNIDVNAKNTKLHLVLLVSFVACVVCTLTSCVLVYLFNSKLAEIQLHVNILNSTLMSLNEKCNNLKYAASDSLKGNKSVETVEESTTTEAVYDYDYGSHEAEVLETYLRNTRASRRDRNRQRTKTADLLAVHFKGSLPEIQLSNQDLIGPWWHEDVSGSSEYKFSKFHLTEGKCSIEITEPALYFVYAQIYYYTTSPKNSYSLCVKNEGSSVEHVIARCSTAGHNNSQMSEVSCFTAGVKILKKNDRVYLKQIEKNRLIILKDGYSFLGFIRLNNSRRVK